MLVSVCLSQEGPNMQTAELKSIKKNHTGTTPLKNQQLMGDGRRVSATSSQAHLPSRLTNSGQAGCSPEKDNCHRGKWESTLYTFSSSFQPSEDLGLADSLCLQKKKQFQN